MRAIGAGQSDRQARRGTIRTYHQLRTPVQLHGMRGLLLQDVQFVLAEQLLVRQELQLMGMLEGGSGRGVHRGPEGGCAVHQFCYG